MIQLIPWIVTIATFVVVKLAPTLFPSLFITNLWLLSWPHTFSTFARSDRRTPKNLLLALGVFLIMLLSLTFTASKWGLVLVYSLYFFWQQFHYAKQNLGIARFQEKKRAKDFRLLDTLFYVGILATTLSGLFHGGTESFFGYNLLNLMVIDMPVWLALSLNGAFLVVYLSIRRSQYSMAIQHTFLFSFAYLGHQNFALGWLLLNVFHNSQYLTFMHEREKQIKVFLYSILTTMIFYLVTQVSLLQGLMWHSFSFILLIMIAVNFTHYTFDGLIWKSKKL